MLVMLLLSERILPGKVRVVKVKASISFLKRQIPKLALQDTNLLRPITNASIVRSNTTQISLKFVIS